MINSDSPTEMVRNLVGERHALTRRFAQDRRLGSTRAGRGPYWLYVAASFALCLWYIVMPSTMSAAIVIIVGLILLFIRPELAVIFLGFGWVGQRQVMTYSSGLPLLVVGLFGGITSLRAGLASLRRDSPFFWFVLISVFYTIMTIIANPAWRNAGFMRLLSIIVALSVYSLCAGTRGRRLFEIASIGCAVIISLNAIIAARIYGEVILHGGDIIDLHLNDANYGSIPIVFGFALVLKRQARGRVWRWPTLFLCVALAAMAWGILVLGSRGAQLAVGVIIALWLLGLHYTPQCRPSLTPRIGVTILVVLATWILIVRVDSNILVGNRSRWEQAIPSGGANRVEIYSQALEAIKLRPLETLVGGGIGHNLDVLGGRNAHNQLLDTLFDYGILGVLSLIWLWTSFFSVPMLGTHSVPRDAESTIYCAAGLGAVALWLAPVWFTFFWIEIAYLAACVAYRVRANSELAR